jgi:hypothetical protein
MPRRRERSRICWRDRGGEQRATRPGHRGPRREGRACVSWLCCALAVFSPLAVSGQAVEGRVVDADAGQPVPSARVMIVDRTGGQVGSALADSTGRFRIAVRWPGRYWLQSEALGYARSMSGPLDVRADEIVEIELGLTVEPIPLAPLVVMSGRPALVLDERLDRRGYYERQAMLTGPLGAHFLEHAELSSRHPWSVEGVLQSLPGVRTRSMGGRDVAVTDRRGRTLSVCLDGVRIGSLSGGLRVDHLVPMSSIVAIEVYPTPSYRTRCSVMIWTGIPSDQPDSR